MIVWLVIVLMIAAIFLAAAWSLTPGLDVETGSDFSIYRDQLDEINRARSAGLISETEAEVANFEVSQRLIASADAAEFKHAIPFGSVLWRCRAAVIAGLVLAPVVAAVLYLLHALP